MSKPIIDGHTHLTGEEDLGVLRSVAARIPLVGFNVLAVTGQTFVRDLALVFLAKHRFPGFAYGFGGLDHSAHLCGAAATPSLAAQARRLATIGVDGLKLIESKPDTRKLIGEPLDGPYYAELFATLEELDMPVLWHVADPEEFWDPARTPKWALERNWGYGPSFPSKESLYAEVERVLARHPRLRVIFAHFFFLSADLDRADRFLAAHPRVRFDLAPGVEYLYNFSRSREHSRDFFVRHADRIVFGTDAGMIAGAPATGVEARIRLVLRFLGGRGEYRIPPEADFLLGPPEDGIIRGLDLPDEAQRLICHDNFCAFAGSKPRTLDRKAAAAECQRLEVGIRDAGGDNSSRQTTMRVAAELCSG